MAAVKTWMGGTVCDMCHKECKDVLLDGRTNLGDWAVMCRKCHKTYGVGIGTGKGQLYTLTDGKWVKTTG